MYSREHPQALQLQGQFMNNQTNNLWPYYKHNWMWKLADGRVFSTQAMDYVDETAQTAWLEMTGISTIPDSPVDTKGNHSEEGLEEALFFYGFKEKESKSLLQSSGSYELCEFYYFRNPKRKQGFEIANGGLLENAATLYPQAWEYLQTSEGQQLCKTEEAWQAMTRAIWHTNADGTTVGWNGIGGAPFYALHADTGALRLPDLRGMYPEAAGFDSLSVGGVHGDGVRNIVGGFIVGWANSHIPVISASGIVSTNSFLAYQGGPTQLVQQLDPYAVSIDASKTVPTATKNQPRAWGALPCVYLGSPTS